ncbi:endolysin [Synechococcus sp. CCY9202]|uniref:endolysin n=1 Tax=Synechococcus sp. CCY9202 TaxID=174698 RepID=UPI003A4C64DB
MLRRSFSLISALSLLGSASAAVLAAPARATEVTDPWSSLPQAPAPRVSTRMVLPSTPPPAPATYAITPERRALLNTIRYAEGTWANGGDLGYWIMFGGGLMDSLERHPNRVVRSARYASAAAGAYQFMPFTWTMASQALGLVGFNAQAQDQAAIFLVQRRGALALADQGQLSPQLVAKLAPEWASFPTLAGSSFYGQPVKRYNDLRRFYDDNLARLRSEQQNELQLASAPARPSCDDDSLQCRLEAVGSAR